MFGNLPFADLLLLIIIGVVMLSFILAPLFMRRPSNHGLRFEHEIKSPQRWQGRK